MALKGGWWVLYCSSLPHWGFTPPGNCENSKAHPDNNEHSEDYDIKNLPRNSNDLAIMPYRLKK